MTREGPLPPPSAEQVASDDFIASIEGRPGHRAIVLSTLSGWYFFSLCAPCAERGSLWAVKQRAQEDADRHNEERKGDEA